MTDAPVQVEATGETVGEARWAALHELERRYPALDRTAVEFVVLSEGQRGLLGVGYEPARVIATLSGEPPAEAAPAPREVESNPDDSPAAARIRALMGQAVDGLGLDASVRLAESEERVTVTVTGDDLGLFIGRHGHTIDAVQYLANAIVHRHEETAVEVVVDAQGYRARRERTLRDVAARAAADAIRTLVEDSMVGLRRLIASFDREATPYHCSPWPEYAPRFTDYAHLARLKEWLLAGESE